MSSPTLRSVAFAAILNTAGKMESTMATKSSDTPSKTQTEMQTFTDALASSSLTLLSSMIVLGSSLSKADVVNKLRAGIALYANVVQTKAAYVAALAARKAGAASTHAFFEAVVANVKQVVGPNNPNLLSTFGLTPPKARAAPSPETMVIAVAKRAATRKARGTLGKVQRSTLSATPAPAVQVVGLTALTPATAPVSSEVPAPAAEPTASTVATPKSS
jgi:uncharacterized glyoxalase superfamily protein PhnB